MSCAKKELQKLSDRDAMSGDVVRLLTFDEFHKSSLKTRVRSTTYNVRDTRFCLKVYAKDFKFRCKYYV